MWKNLTGAFVGAVAFAMVAPANASSVLLQDANSTSLFEINGGSNQIQANWFVDGVSQLYEQNFYIDVGATGGAPIALGSIAPNAFNAVDTNGSGNVNNLFVRWDDVGGTGVQVGVEFRLTGALAGSGASDVAETITISNFSGQATDLRFFQYVDFDLDGTIGGDTVSSSTDPVQSITQSDVSVLTEAIVTPGPDLYQVGPFSTIRDAIVNGNNLTTSPGTQSSYGPGDATWAFQWNVFGLANNDSFQISKDKNIRQAPEPATLGLLGVGLAGLGFAARRRRKAA
jgi:hypothetical protein